MPHFEKIGFKSKNKNKYIELTFQVIPFWPCLAVKTYSVRIFSGQSIDLEFSELAQLIYEARDQWEPFNLTRPDWKELSLEALPGAKIYIHPPNDPPVFTKNKQEQIERADQRKAAGGNQPAQRKRKRGRPPKKKAAEVELRNNAIDRIEAELEEEQKSMEDQAQALKEESQELSPEELQDAKIALAAKKKFEAEQKAKENEEENPTEHSSGKREQESKNGEKIEPPVEPKENGNNSGNQEKPK